MLFSSIPFRRACALTLLSALLLIICVAGLYCEPKPLFTGKECRPADAIILFDGKDLSQWESKRRGNPATWKIENDYMRVRGGSIQTKQEFTDYQLHVEFWLPKMDTMKGQDRANSGVFMIGAYEVQLLDSYGLESGKHDCGAIYSIKAPLVNACRPPEQWQKYDIIFHAPKFDETGKKTANARISVLQNGVWIHENEEIPYPTASHNSPDSAKGPIELQDHGNPLRFRNVWIRPL